MNETFEIIGGSLRRYSGSEKEVCVPEGVTEIGYKAFEGNNRIRKVILPESVVRIRRFAFARCGNLEEIQLPEGLAFIESYAFYFCCRLSEISLPENLKKIGLSAFSVCESLTSVRIPKRLEVFGRFVFSGCLNLADVQFPSDLETIPEGTFFRCVSLGTLALPPSLKNIGNSAFHSTENLSLRLPKGLQKLGYHAFACAQNIKVLFPLHFTTLPDGLFERAGECSMFAPNVPFASLSAVERKASVVGYAEAPADFVAALPKEEEEEYLRYLRRYRKKFYLRMEKTEGLLQKMIEYRLIPYEDIEDLVKLLAGSPSQTAMLLEYQQSLLTPEMLRKLERKAKREEERIFSGAAATASEMKNEWIFEKLDNGTYLLRSYKGTSTEIIVPDRIGKCEVSAVDDYAFSPFRPRLTEEQQAFRHTITSVMIPDTVKRLGEHLFDGCSSLEEVRLSEGITDLSEAVFCDCKHLISVNLPESLKRIHKSAFSNCSSLTRLVLPEGIGKIEKLAFQGCSSLTEINLPRKLRSIAPSLFENCLDLKEIHLPEGVTSIGACAFHNCLNLKNLYLSEKIQQIGNNAFQYCNSLIIHTQKGSFAERFLQKRDIRHNDLENRLNFVQFIECKKSLQKIS